MAITHVTGSPLIKPVSGSTTGPTSLDRTIAPLSNMVVEDWMAVVCYVRQNNAPTVLATGGQTWTTETDINQGTTAHSRLFHCRFNGTWSADPQFGVAASTEANQVVAFILRGVAYTNVDAVSNSGLDLADGGAAYTAPGSPFDVTRAGQTATTAGLAMVVFGSSDDNSWALQTGGGWVDHGFSANTGGLDASIHAVSLPTAGGATGSVVSRQTANGGDAGIAHVWIARAATNTTVTPTTLALTTSTFAPVVTATNHQLVTPTTASLTATTFAPTVTASDHKTATPTTTALTTATFAPTVALSDNQAVIPTTRALTTATFAPTVALSDNQAVIPTTAGLTTATFAPTVTVSDHQAVTPSTAALSLTSFAPIIALTDAQAFVPQPASLTLTPRAPTVTATGQVEPPAISPSTGGAFKTTPYTVEFFDPITVVPQVAHLRTKRYIPSVEVVALPNFDIEELVMMGVL